MLKRCSWILVFALMPAMKNRNSSRKHRLRLAKIYSLICDLLHRTCAPLSIIF